MSIWIHENVYSEPSENDVTRKTCLFCGTKLWLTTTSSQGVLEREIRVCSCCGWWSRNRRYRTPDYDSPEPMGILKSFYSMSGACAQLRNLDVSDISTPLRDLREYLLAKYSARFQVSSKRLEDLVGSIFLDHGFESQVTAFQNDGGIDVILSRGKENIGVQVKRYKNRIEAEQIRAFAGALMLGDHPSGIFITTSEYRSGALSAASEFSSRGIPIELIDANRFYDALKFNSHEDISEDSLEEFTHKMTRLGDDQVIYEDEGPY